MSTPAKLLIHHVHGSDACAHKSVHDLVSSLNRRSAFSGDQILLIQSTYSLGKHSVVNGPTPKVKQLVLRYRHVLERVLVLMIPGVGPIHHHYFKSLSSKEQIWPCEEKKHCCVEQDANPGGKTPAIGGVFVVDFDNIISDGKADTNVTTVICIADECCEPFLKQICIQTDNPSFDLKSLKSRMASTVPMAPLSKCGLSRIRYGWFLVA